MKWKRLDSTTLLIISLIPCIINTAILGSYYTNGDIEMSTWLQIVFSVGSTVGVIVVAIINVRSGNKKIDENYSEVRNMSPKVDNTLDHAKKISEYTVEKIYPDISNLHTESSKVIQLLGDIHEDVRYRQRLNAEYSGKLSKDIMVTGIEDVYKENVTSIRNEIMISNFNGESAK